MTLQEKIKQIGDALAALTPNVYHYWRPQMEPPFVVWAETGESGAFNADNRKREQAVEGTVDYYTKTEYDPLCDSLQQTLNALGIGWQLDNVQYEPETNLIHYTWSWEVAGIAPQ